MTSEKVTHHSSVINYLESNQMKEEDFGQYVEGLHSLNNRAFVIQYEVCAQFIRLKAAYLIMCTKLQSLASGEDGRKVSIGKTDENKVLNRFRNIIACELILSVASKLL